MDRSCKKWSPCLYISSSTRSFTYVMCLSEWQVGGVHSHLISRVQRDKNRVGFFMSQNDIMMAVFPMFQQHIEPHLVHAHVSIPDFWCHVTIEFELLFSDLLFCVMIWKWSYKITQLSQKLGLKVTSTGLMRRSTLFRCFCFFCFSWSARSRD